MGITCNSTFTRTKLRNVCLLTSSGGTPSRKRPEYFCAAGEGHLWVKSKELLDNSISATKENITNEGIENSSAKYYPANTILLAMYGANVGQLGWLKKEATINQAICGMIVNDKVADWRYVFYAIMAGRHKLVAKAFGAAQQNLNQDIIRDFEIPLPSLSVQQKVSSILSAYDDLIENNNRRLKILEEMAQRIYRECFVDFRYPGHENDKLVDSELGMIPEGWKVVKLGDAAQQTRNSVSPNEIDPKTPYFGLEHLPRKSIALGNWGYAEEVQSTKLAFKKGDILFGKIRPYFHKVGVAPLDGICSGDTIVITSNQPAHKFIVLCCVSSTDFVNHATQTSQGTKMPRANWDVLVEYQVLIPSKDVLLAFNELMETVVSQIINHIFRNRILHQTRDLLLPKLISGEIDVSELDIEIGENMNES